MNPDICLETSRLYLRRWREGDLVPFRRMNRDPAVIEFLPGPLSDEESDALAERADRAIAERGYGLYAVEVKSAGRFAGFVGLSMTAPGFRFGEKVEVGWRLCREAWGYGYATEAGRRCLEHGFSCGLDEIVSFTYEGNRRSRAVMERLGMHRNSEDDFDHPRIPEGHPLRRHVLYRLTRDEWSTETRSHDGP